MVSVGNRSGQYPASIRLFQMLQAGRYADPQLVADTVVCRSRTHPTSSRMTDHT